MPDYSDLFEVLERQRDSKALMAESPFPSRASARVTDAMKSASKEDASVDRVIQAGAELLSSILSRLFVSVDTTSSLHELGLAYWSAYVRKLYRGPKPPGEDKRRVCRYITIKIIYIIYRIVCDNGHFRTMSEVIRAAEAEESMLTVSRVFRHGYLVFDEMNWRRRISFVGVLNVAAEWIANNAGVSYWAVSAIAAIAKSVAMRLDRHHDEHNNDQRRFIERVAASIVFAVYNAVWRETRVQHIMDTRRAQAEGRPYVRRTPGPPTEQVRNFVMVVAGCDRASTVVRYWLDPIVKGVAHEATARGHSAGNFFRPDHVYRIAASQWVAKEVIARGEAKKRRRPKDSMPVPLRGNRRYIPRGSQ